MSGGPCRHERQNMSRQRGRDRIQPVLPVSALDIVSYRSLRELRLVDVGKVNLFVGGTNTGKTSVLESLSLLLDPFDVLVWSRVANRREPSPFAAMASSNVDRLRYLFPADDRRIGAVSISLAGRHPLRSFVANAEEVRGLRPSRVVVDEDDDEAHAQAIEAQVERRGLRLSVVATINDEIGQRTFFPETSVDFTVWEGESVFALRRPRLPGRLPLRVVTPYDHWLRSPVTHGLSEAVLAGEEFDLVQLMREIEPRISDIRLIEHQREPMVYLKDARAGFLPISSYGDGIRRVFAVALAVRAARGGILLVDEIETGLHVSMLKRVFGWLWQACSRLDVQLFATTHSLEALDALLESDLTEEEDTIVYQLHASPSGSTARRIGETQLRRLRRERGLDVR